MKVKEILALLSTSTPWKLVGVRSGKILCRNSSPDKQKNMYRECEVTLKPIVVGTEECNDYCSFTGYDVPIIIILVSGL